MESNKKKEIIGIVLRVALAVGLFLAAILNYDKLAKLDVKALLSNLDNTWLIILVSLGIYILKGCVFVVPASMVYIGIGMVLPSWIAVIVNCVGILLELTVSYLIGRFIGGDAVNKILSRSKSGQKLLSKNLQDNKWGTFGLRFASAPIDLVSLLYGAAKASFVPFLLFSFLGIAPRVIVLTFVGDKFFDYVPMALLMKIVIAAIPVVLVFWLLKKFWWDKRKAAKEQAAAGEADAPSETAEPEAES